MGRAVSRRGPRHADERLSEARLQLAEFLLLSDSAEESARHDGRLADLAHSARHALCAALDASGLGSSASPPPGSGHSTLPRLSVDMDQSRHRLVMALSRTQPMIVRVSAREPRRWA